MKIFSTIALMFMLLGITSISHALPFDIVPYGSLPTSIISGGSVSAYYTVTNNTGTTRVDNYVKYLSPHVEQITSGVGVCSNTFTLAAKGQLGDSCILSLNITGAVDAKDPNPHHHLFVCFPGGVTCAGTDYPLDVTALPAAYVVNFGSNSVSFCSIDESSGLLSCTDSGATQLTGPSGVAFNPSRTFGYITNFLDLNTGAQTTVTICPFNASTGLFDSAGCVVNDGYGDFFAPFSITFNASGTFAYVANFYGTDVTVCAVDQNTGAFDSCNNTNSVGPFDDTTDITFSPSGMAYVTNQTGQPTVPIVSLCSVNPTTGLLHGCIDSGTDNYSSLFAVPSAIAFNPAYTFAYITNWAGGGGNTVTVCQVTPGTGILFNCLDSGIDTFAGPADVAINLSGTLAYVSNTNSSIVGTIVSVCQIDPSSGLFDSCTPSGSFNAPIGVALL